MVNHPSRTCIHRQVSLIFLEIGFMVLISGLKCLLSWECLSLYGRFDYVEIIKFLRIKIIISCRSSTPICFVYGHLQPLENRGLFMEAVHNYRLRRAILFLNMGGRKIYKLVHHHLFRRFAIALNDMYFVFYSRLRNCWTAKYTLIMQWLKKCARAALHGMARKAAV
jgi:hypothetical protein